MNTRKVLILGGNGFLGYNLSKKLLNEGFEVTSFDCREPVRKLTGISYVTGDFFDDKYLEELVQGNDIIYHAISTINPGNSNEFYMRGYLKDFAQSIKLCDLVDRYHKKLIFFPSGGTVYGVHDEEKISEEVACQPINHYGTIKRCIETAYITFRLQHKTNVIIARISNPYGPGQDSRRGVGIIDAAIRHGRENTAMEVWGNGEVVRDYIYVDDVCTMLYDLANYDGNDYIFNISTGIGHSVNDVIRIVKNYYPELHVEYKPGRPVDLPRNVLDNSRMMEIYSGKLVSLEDGIKRLINIDDNINAVGK